jgi:hypothetical protein
MVSDQYLFAGIDIAPGRKPYTYVTLDEDLEISTPVQSDVSETMSRFAELERVRLAINVPASKTGKDIFADFCRKLGQAGFKKGEGELQWLETNAEECFRAYQPKLLPRRTLDGRIQRALILYEEGLRFSDPMDYYEEITRHKLLQGILPAETIYSTRQLEALAAAYVGWLAENRPGQVMNRGEMTLPKVTASDPEDTEQLTYL